jgi:uncharacterized membrane protein
MARHRKQRTTDEPRDEWGGEGRPPPDDQEDAMSERGETAPPPALGPGQGVRVEERIVVDRTPAELFRLWRDLETMGRVFRHVERVECRSSRRSHWVAKGPLRTHVEWDAEVINEIADRLIGWQSLPGSEVACAGSVRFEPYGDGATEVTVVFRYDPPGGKLAVAVAGLLGVDPATTVAEDLARFKRQVESGRVPTEDEVEIASEQSFPASDAPSWTAR